MSTNRILSTAPKPTDNLTATAAPIATDDSSKGYSVGSTWIDATNHNVYSCVNSATGAAVWVQQNGLYNTASDPVNPTPGSIWINSITMQMKTAQFVPASAWVTNTSLPQARYQSAMVGDASSSLLTGGHTTATTTNTMTFDGSVWANSVAMPTAVEAHANVGTVSNILSFGGRPTSYAALFSGAVWSTVANTLLTGRAFCGGAGSPTAAFVFGASPVSVSTELYNGTTWSYSVQLPVALQYPRGAGTATSALSFSGYTGSVNVNNTNLFDGTTWTAKAVYPVTCRANTGNGSSSSAAMGMGGYGPPFYANTYAYDGTAWTALANISVARADLASTGTPNSTICAGGGHPDATVESYADATPIKIFTAV